MNSKKGLFITFEGADGCGKTTQIEILDKYLKNKNYETIVTLEPGGSDIGKNLTKYSVYVLEIVQFIQYFALFL